MSDLERIELSIETAREKVKAKNSMEKLIKNKEFVKIIEKGYFEQHASKLVLLKASPHMQGSEDQKTLSKELDAIGFLWQFIHSTLQKGEAAERAIEVDTETLSEILNEEGAH